MLQIFPFEIYEKSELGALKNRFFNLCTKMLLRVLRNALQAYLAAGLLLEVDSQQIR